MTFIMYFCEVYICRRNTDDLVWLILYHLVMYALMYFLETCTRTIQVTGHVLPRLTIPDKW